MSSSSYGPSVLVTGGRGAVARAVAARLAERAIPFRLGSREPGPPGASGASGAPGAVHLDLTDPATFPAALEGIRTVFLYAEAAAIDAFVKEATAAGVEHVVLLSSSSVLGADATENALAASHLAVEQALLASPLRTTLLRPGAFASNALGWAWAMKSGTPIRLPYPGAYADPVHEADIADAAVAVLSDPALAGGAYTLTGPQSLTFAAQLAVLSGVLGRSVPFETITPEQWKADVEGFVPGSYADALLAHWAAQDGIAMSVTDEVERLTGHPARTFETWAEDHAEAFS
ncbi:NAD(P)H-binding protein [Streptomyces sp. NPDC090022]|uniref:NAD(P)H-binding protein n=1 Tax=Streptomyces sp. NPDC090022 TaxID=3365920 RepID=UPI0037FA3489